MVGIMSKKIIRSFCVGFILGVLLLVPLVLAQTPDVQNEQKWCLVGKFDTLEHTEMFADDNKYTNTYIKSSGGRWLLHTKCPTLPQ